MKNYIWYTETNVHEQNIQVLVQLTFAEAWKLKSVEIPIMCIEKK